MIIRQTHNASLICVHYKMNFDDTLCFMTRVRAYVRACVYVFSFPARGGLKRMGPRPPRRVPLFKSYGSSILSTSLGSKTLHTSSLGLGGGGGGI